MADPYFSSVVLLAINDNKGNGTTSFADQSPIARAITANGNAQYSTAQFPTGMSSSYAGDGTGDFLSALDSTEVLELQAQARRDALLALEEEELGVVMVAAALLLQ